uniref:DNA polymerase II subunit 2 n=1 Tax=Romanomermis culicivorax TaxID=13658 RepID=A0A915HFK2_ROMCU
MADPRPRALWKISNQLSTFQSGIFTENCVVLAEGCFCEGIFKAKAVGLPPIEDAQKTRDFFGPINIFGGSAKQCVKSISKLVEIERKQCSAAFVILSDVWLDDNLVNGFKALVDLIQEFPLIVQQSHFIFVPSLQDHLLNGIFPKPPLPSSVLSNVLSKLPRHHLATNPCRVQFFSQEIVIFREDIIEKMCRNCVKVPTDVRKLHHHFARTILSQNHLCPLPLNVSPVYWPFDFSMQLYPIPDLIICCDKYVQYTEKFHDCIITNPGSFSTSKFIFQVYYPVNKEVDDSSLPED